MFKKLFTIDKNSDYKTGFKDHVLNFFKNTPPPTQKFNSNGHELNLFFKLNNVWVSPIEPDREIYFGNLCQTFEQAIIRTMIYNSKLKQLNVDKEQKAIILDYVDLDDSEFCFKCGKRHYLRIMRDGTIMERNFENKETEIIPLRECSFKEEVIHRTLTFKTDTLIMSDYFRFKDSVFTNWIGEKTIDINSAKGMVAETERYLDKNIFKVQVGNTCPSVFQKGNTFYFGSTNEESEDKLERIGYICTDMWATTIMEKATLVDLLIKNGRTKKEALKQIKETTHAEVKIKPGKYEITYNILTHELDEKYDKFSEKHLRVLYFVMKKVK